MNKRRRISAVLLWAGFLLLSLSISASAGVTKKRRPQDREKAGSFSLHPE